MPYKVMMKEFRPFWKHEASRMPLLICVSQCRLCTKLYLQINLFELFPLLFLLEPYCRTAANATIYRCCY